MPFVTPENWFKNSLNGPMQGTSIHGHHFKHAKCMSVRWG